MTYGVITGDIIHFTSAAVADREALIADTGQLIKAWVSQPQYAEIFRGDSFQLLFDDIGQALRRSIQLRCWLMQHTAADQKNTLDARISIGIGAISYFGNSVLDADGEAFHLSGRAFDEMKNTHNDFQIITSNPALNGQLQVILNLANIIISSWTKNQASVIFLLLEGKTQQQMAQALQIGQSAVNNRIKLSRWKEIDKTIQYIESLLIH